MKEYHKIRGLYKFNMEEKAFDKSQFTIDEFAILQNNQWIFTEKIDGTNLRIMWDGHKLSYAGRTDNATFTEYQKLFIETHLVNSDIVEKQFEQLFMEKVVIVYGELFGAGIQKGGLYGELQFMAFDIEIDDIFLTKENARGLANTLGYEFVPTVLIGTINDGLEYVNLHDKSSFSQAILEGLVGTPAGDFRDRLGKRIITKIKREDMVK